MIPALEGWITLTPIFTETFKSRFRRLWHGQPKTRFLYARAAEIDGIAKFDAVTWVLLAGNWISVADSPTEIVEALDALKR